MPKTAILVDGDFYLRRARSIWGNKTPEERAEELVKYARYHILRNNRSRLEGGKRSLYRLFYYDCPQSWERASSSHGTEEIRHLIRTIHPTNGIKSFRN